MLLKYTDLLKQNRQLKETSKGKPVFALKLLNNITVNMLRDVLEFRLRSAGLDADVQLHDYDTIIPDSLQLAADATPRIIFWELGNYMPGLYYSHHSFTGEQLDSLEQKICADIDLVFANCKHSSIVFVNTFSAAPFSLREVRQSKLAMLAQRLNAYLVKHRPNNVHLVDVDQVYMQYSVAACIDMRMFNNSKSLHTLTFFQGYADLIMPVILSIAGKAKKALIFDCDNTLWAGVIGEDGMEGIDMSASSSKGSFFHQVQRMAVELSKQGIIVGLNTKNNPADVEEVLRDHPDMFLKDEHLVIKKINWTDKVSNLKAIAKDLNIGIDSLVFIDDSSFELAYVQEQLPEVATFAVPKNLYEYPAVMAEAARLFYHHAQTKEDAARVQMYKDEQTREKEKEAFASIEDYLRSLSIGIDIFTNDQSLVPRTAQMTQKTNQFNLTTKRYTDNDILSFIQDPNHIVHVFEVKDKFGTYGITGLCVIALQGKEASIDTFLMSCRVLGRRIESSFLAYVLEDLKQKGIETVKAAYYKTAKNAQVSHFYENNGFAVSDNNDDIKHYTMDLTGASISYPDFIEIRQFNEQA